MSVSTSPDVGPSTDSTPTADARPADAHPADARADALRIGRADLDDPGLQALLAEHVADMHAITPAEESCHVLDLDALRRPEVQQWEARIGADVVGTLALVDLGGGHEELKSMRTSSVHRGRGIARRMLEAVLADARERGVVRVSLETGTEDAFAPARALYLSSGFVACDPFGDYVPDPLSVFLTRDLSA
ncbi:GNAT family N-acetyltransferase [Brachybacterium sp. DNPG3]